MRSIMKKLVTFGFILVSLALAIGMVSATLCNDGSGYYYDCSDSAPFDHSYQGPSGKSSVNYYGVGSSSGSGSYNYDNLDTPSTPIFKGSYGNYRYQMYANGDTRPSLFFVDYPETGVKPYFSGGGRYYPYSGYGYGNYYGGYGGFYGFGYGSGYGYYPSYSYNNYGVNYYPSYTYTYSGCGYYC